MCMSADLSIHYLHERQKEGRMVTRDAVKQMDAAMQCLYLAVDKSIADDVFGHWIRVKQDHEAALKAKDEQIARLEDELRMYRIPRKQDSL